MDTCACFSLLFFNFFYVILSIFSQVEGASTGTQGVTALHLKEQQKSITERLTEKVYSRGRLAPEIVYMQ